MRVSNWDKLFYLDCGDKGIELMPLSLMTNPASSQVCEGATILGGLRSLTQLYLKLRATPTAHFPFNQLCQ
ncbi:hypothetical protein DJ62_3479 [Yersinia enterocolitica]|nr:hypothetical protein DJ62_3479 [Yersinia enterocolitica]